MKTNGGREAAETVLHCHSLPIKKVKAESAVAAYKRENFVSLIPRKFFGLGISV